MVLVDSVDSEPILPCYPIVVKVSLWNVKKYEFCFYKGNIFHNRLKTKMDTILDTI